MEIELRKLGPKELADRENNFQYESDGYFRVRITENVDGWAIDMKREDFPEIFRKCEREKVITPYKGDSEIYGAFIGGKEAGLIQFEYQEWCNSVRVWDIDVLPEFRRKGVGKALMEHCISRARELGARRVILETQTSNLKAISFYRSMGFHLAGMDTSNYHNDDIARNEVRLEMARYLD